MNQILEIKNFQKRKKQIKKFKIQFFISLILVFSFSIYWLYIHNIRNKKNSVSNALLNNYNIDRLYSHSKNHIAEHHNTNTNFIIGIIEIPKINIIYPIISNIDDELLKISTCKFYGPPPNKIGNLCIAGHNYNDNRFFSNLYQLNIGDIIKIYDTNNCEIIYSVYNKFEISKSDTSCTSQNTNGKREITLVTCNNINNHRLIIKATELHDNSV